MEQVFVLAPERDATLLDLSAAEGYLLSRIDGSTPWRLLRQIGGIPPDQVDSCLTEWLEDGLLEVVSGRPAKTATACVESPESPVPVDIDESVLSPLLEIDVDVQRRILEFEASLARPYHELLGVQRGAAPKTVKRAYFALSKEFHPDRYFRKEIGGYGERLERIFKKVLEAHEILSDPELCQVANQGPAEVVAEPVVEAAQVPPPTAASSDQPAKPRELTKLERLRQRMPFKINHAAIAERRARADEIFRAAQASQQAGRMQEAEASLRIAISFDPARAEFKEALGSLRIQAAGARASRLLASPSERMSDSELREALQLLEDVLPYRPHDPELNERAARVSFQLGRHRDACDYAKTLLERSPEYAPAHTLLGKIYKEQGDLELAVGAFERALKYDEDDLEARRALSSVRIGARDAARGGQS
jgi:curved DNA-binding protein CbpA